MLPMTRGGVPAGIRRDPQQAWHRIDGIHLLFWACTDHAMREVIKDVRDPLSLSG